MWQILQLLFPNSYFFPPKKDEFNFKLAQYCINKARSASSIWNHKYDFRPKLHDTRFNYHFITSILKSLKYRTWLVQIFYWCSTCMHWCSKLNLCPPSMDLHHESPQLLKPTSTGKDLDSKVLKITSWTALSLLFYRVIIMLFHVFPGRSLAGWHSQSTCWPTSSLLYRWPP